MRVALIFPPPFDLTQPYIGLPMMASFLKKAGYETKQFDFNIKYYNHILERRTIADLSDRIERSIHGLSDGRAKENLTRALRLARHLVESGTDVAKIFKNKETFVDANSYDRGIHTLNRVCEIVSSAYYPTSITPNFFQMRYKTSSIEQIILASSDEKENPFSGVLRAKFVPEVMAYEPAVVGISVVFSDQLIGAITTARVVKEISPESRVVIGGEILSRIARHRPDGLRLLDGVIDAIVVDDGREPILEFCRQVATGRALTSSPRLVVPSSPQPVPPKPAAESSLESFGQPDYEDTDWAEYFSPEPLVATLLGKGCAWGKCTFCTESFAKNYSAKSLPFLIEEIKALISQVGVRCVNFADSDISPLALKYLADSLIAAGISITWSCRARLDPRFNLQLFQLLYLAGCRKIYFGLESGSQRILKLMRKGTTVKNAEDVLEACSKSGISTHLFSFCGFPGETRDDAQQTVEFLIRNSEYIGSFNIGSFNLREESDVFLEADHFGIISTLSDTINGDLDDHPYEVGSGIDMEEARALASKMTSEVFDRTASKNHKYAINSRSSYVTHRGMPMWDSHNLLYITEYSADWFHTKGTQDLDETVVWSGKVVELGTRHDGHTVVYVPETGKLLALTAAGYRILRTFEGCGRSIHSVDASGLNQKTRFLHMALRELLLVPC